MKSSDLTRRDVVKGLGTLPLLASTGLMGQEEPASKPAIARIGIIGVGARGTGHVRTLLSVKGVEITAIADIDPTAVSRALGIIGEAHRTAPAVYQNGPEDFRNLVNREEVDAVIIATPWRWHVPMAVAAMKAGKFAGVEVPAALTVHECWELVNTSESTGVWCMMLENVCYYRELLQILNMVREGQLGELLHCSGGYQHDYRLGTFDDKGNISEKNWYAKEILTRDGNLYPTHSVGPMAQCLNIDRGDRFDYLVSVSSKAVGLNKWVKAHFGPDHPNAKRAFALGDISTTIIKTANGATITLYYDCQAPRPYDLAFLIQGTQGIYEMCRDSIHLDEISPHHQWEPLEKYREQYEHPLWKRYGTEAVNFGHNGGDYIMLQRFAHSVATRTAPEQDVYDAAAWSVISPLSEKSVAGRGVPVKFPDFTRGKWKTRTPVPIISA